MNEIRNVLQGLAALVEPHRVSPVHLAMANCDLPPSIPRLGAGTYSEFHFNDADDHTERHTPRVVE
jgi:hypothetical protein